MLLYHYTSLDAFVNIIKSKKFRLCDITKSNDPLEGTYIPQALEESCLKLYREERLNRDEYMLAHRAILKFNDDITVYDRAQDFYGAASFCLPEHELLMLRSYADNGKGVALGVTLKTLEKTATSYPCLSFKKIEYLHQTEVNKRTDDFLLENVMYFKDKILEISDESLSPFVKRIQEYYHEGYFLKDKINEDEAEYRLLLHCNDIFKIRIGLREEIPQEIDFFSSNGQLKAYYEIDVGDRWHDTYPFYFNCVVIGPQCKASITEVQAFLLRHGILGCSVIKNSWAQMR